ncbi:MAG: glycerol-3-phosphate acyltransferase [Bacillota bacterium]
MLRYLLLAYLIGSLPTAYLITRLFGRRDIRKIGSRNVGATNVVAQVGWLAGILTLVGDMGKGYLAALTGGVSAAPILPFLTPAVAIAGHNWPVWLRFHGGGGLATFVGGCLAVTNWNLIVPIVSIALWGLVYLFIRDHDRSAVVTCVLLPCAALVARQPAPTVTFVATSSLMILLRRVQSIRQRVRQRVRNWRDELAGKGDPGTTGDPEETPLE